MFTHEMIKSFNQLEMDVYNYIISNEEKVVYMKVREPVSYTHLRYLADGTSTSE